MGKTYEQIDDELQSFIEAQQMFFVATAPSVGGRVNISPKGLDSFRVVSPQQVAWVDLTGSGIETIAHLRDNGRITVMFCAFTGAPNIVRLYGTAVPVFPGDDGFDDLYGGFDDFKGLRSIISMTVVSASDSCGYGVPLMEFKDERRTMTAWADKKSPEEITAYQNEKNVVSIDGLPGLQGLPGRP